MKTAEQKDIFIANSYCKKKSIKHDYKNRDFRHQAFMTSKYAKEVTEKENMYGGTLKMLQIRTYTEPKEDLTEELSCL